MHNQQAALFCGFTGTAEKILVDKGMLPKEAREVSTHRIFGGINGNYGTGIQGMTMASDRWEKESELAYELESGEIIYVPE